MPRLDLCWAAGGSDGQNGSCGLACMANHDVDLNSKSTLMDGSTGAPLCSHLRRCSRSGTFERVPSCLVSAAPWMYLSLAMGHDHGPNKLFLVLQFLKIWIQDWDSDAVRLVISESMIYKSMSMSIIYKLL